MKHQRVTAKFPTANPRDVQALYIRFEVYGPGGEKRPKHRSAAKTVTALHGTLVPLFGHRPITELTTTEILKPIELIGQVDTDCGLLKLKLRKQLRRPGGKSRPAQPRALFTFMEMMLNWASAPDAQDGLERSPLDRVRPSRQLGRTEPRGHTFNDEELAALQPAISRLPPPYRQAYQMLSPGCGSASLWALAGPRSRATSGPFRPNG